MCLFFARAITACPLPTTSIRLLAWILVFCCFSDIHFVTVTHNCVWATDKSHLWSPVFTPRPSSDHTSGFAFTHTFYYNYFILWLLPQYFTNMNFILYFSTFSGLHPILYRHLGLLAGSWSHFDLGFSSQCHEDQTFLIILPFDYIRAHRNGIILKSITRNASKFEQFDMSHGNKGKANDAWNESKHLKGILHLKKVHSRHSLTCLYLCYTRDATVAVFSHS